MKLSKVLNQKTVTLGLFVIGMNIIQGCGTESSGGTFSVFGTKRKTQKDAKEFCDDRTSMYAANWNGDINCGPAPDSRLMGRWEYDKAHSLGTYTTPDRQGHVPAGACSFGVSSAELIVQSIEFFSDKSCQLVDGAGTSVPCLWSNNQAKNYGGVSGWEHGYAAVIRYTVGEGNQSLGIESMSSGCHFIKTN